MVDKCGVDPNNQDNKGNAALHHAAMCQCLNILNYFIKDKHCSNEGIKKVLHLVTHDGDLQVLLHLIEECGVDPESCRDDKGLTLLHSAAASRQLRIMQYLIQEKHCDPMSRDKKGFTALHMAALYGYLEVAQYLIDECGVNPGSCQDNEGRTPLHSAAINDQFEVLKYLVNVKHCDPMCRDDDGITPLHFVATCGHLQAVQCLIDECGVDPESCLDEAGLTLLHCAALCGQLNVVRYLTKEKHCDPMLKSKNGHAAIQYAADRGHTQVVQYFIDECGVHPEPLQHSPAQDSTSVQELIQQVAQLTTTVANLSQSHKEDKKQLGTTIYHCLCQ